MIHRTLLILAIAGALAACEKKTGAGFTGIGPATSQSAISAYALDFEGLSLLARPVPVAASDIPTNR